MDTRFLAFVVALICIFASNNSEGKRKLADNGVHWDALLIDKDKAERVWNYCRQELKDSTEAVKSLGLELPQSRTSSLNGLELDTVKRIIHTSVVDLPPNKKEKFLDCLREKKSPLQISTDEGETSPNQYQKLFSGWISIPRRFLRSHPVIRTDSSPGPTLSPDVSAKAPIHEPPVHSPSPVFQPPVSAPEPSYTPSDIYFPPKSMENDSPLPTQDNNDTKKYVIIAACASLVAGLAIIALFLLCCMKKKNQRVEPKEGQRDEKPLLNFSTSDISAGSSEKSHIVNPNNKDFKATSSAGGYADASQANSEPPEVSADGKTANLPLPPGRTAPPPPPPGPPPPPPKPPAPVPPPLPKVGRRPPNPPAPSPLGPHHRRSSTGEASAKADDDSEAPKTKLKPFFWDKVLASPDHSMVWHEIKAGSFQFNEEMMESLFGYVPADKNKNDQKKDGASSDTPPQFIQIIDPKKSQNLAILLKALNVTTEEVCDALNEGNELPAELIQTLLRMAPTADEELKLRLYSDDVSHLGPAERFLKVVVDIPFAFKRLESLLFVNTFQEEDSSMKESFETLEVACKELRNSRLFLKLLEAVLKTGNRMNDGTYRGGAQAFKLDTLLKLSDVKGTDGKTTLLHFVVQEIIRGEGLRAARRLRESPSISSVKTEDLGGEDHSQESEDYYRSLGLQVVAGLSNELQNVKKAAIIDNESLSESVFKLRQALVKTKEFLDTEMKTLEGENEFRDALASFTHQSESDIEWLIEEDKRIMALVRSTGDYFHGKAGRDECKHLFVIVRDFLLMVDKACLDIKNSSKLPPRTPRKENLVSSPTPSSQDSPTESPLDIHRRLFPAMRERQMDDDSSPDDEK